MLAACQEHSRYFSDFDFQQLIDLAKELTILYFDDGETVLTQGEPATFFGVVLQGAVVAVVNSVRMGTARGVGEVIGESSLFAGGTRNASIVATAGGYLAVFSFAQLDNLFSSNPSLAKKLSRQLALATIDKQAEMERRPRSTEERERGVSELLVRQQQRHWSSHASAANSGTQPAESLLRAGRRSSVAPGRGHANASLHPEGIGIGGASVEGAPGHGEGPGAADPSMAGNGRAGARHSTAALGARVLTATMGRVGRGLSVSAGGAPDGHGSVASDSSSSHHWHLGMTPSNVMNRFSSSRHSRHSQGGGGGVGSGTHGSGTTCHEPLGTSLPAVFSVSDVTDALELLQSSGSRSPSFEGLGGHAGELGDGAGGWATRLGDEAIRRLAPLVAGVPFGPGEVLFRAGEPAMCCAILAAGTTAEARVQSDSMSGTNGASGGASLRRDSDAAGGAPGLIIRMAGDFVGEDALFTHAPRRTDIVGVDEGTLLVLSFADLNDLSHHSPDLHHHLTAAIATSVTAALSAAHRAMDDEPTGGGPHGGPHGGDDGRA